MNGWPTQPQKRARHRRLATKLEGSALHVTVQDEDETRELNRLCVGNDLVYLLEKPEEDGNEIRDKRIDAFFSPDGKAHWIAANISGLAEKGCPGRR